MRTAAREAWLGIRDGAPDEVVRDTIFESPSGSRGRLTHCHITGQDSAHPGNWMFRLDDPVHPDRWHWEMSLAPVSTPDEQHARYLEGR